MKREQGHNRPYYEAYDDRYKQVHAFGMSWESDQPTKIVTTFLKKYNITPDKKGLEIGCGEGRDAIRLLNKHYQLTAADISEEAIRYCRTKYPACSDHFLCLDCLHGEHNMTYDYIYAVAVLHMLTEDEDRQAFYRFIRDHLKEGSTALICTMGDGEYEMESDAAQAFEMLERRHRSGRMMKVAATTCRMVSFDSFLSEIHDAGLTLCEKGISDESPSFNQLMYAVVKKAE